MSRVMRDFGRAASPASFEGRKFLSCRLSKEEYGIDILRVREILGLVELTPLPHTEDSVRGVCNRRGRIVPVIDLRRALGMPPAAPTADTCIVVVELESAAEPACALGCIVDSVAEVVAVGDDCIAPSPRSGNGPWDRLTGIATVKDRVLFLLDLERVLMVRPGVAPGPPS